MAKRKNPKSVELDAGYEAKKEYAARVSRDKATAGRDVSGDFPAVVNPARKAQGIESLEYFCRVYLAATFSLPWSPDHRTVIAKIEKACRVGGLFANAMPRGAGKTSLAIAGALWSMLAGLQQFVALIGSDEPSATSMLESIRSELECNNLLMGDWPEVCHPIRRLGGIAHRANGQLFRGERTHIGWTAKEIVLPAIPGSLASSAIVRVAGITGRIRGMQFTRPDGKKVRPGMVIVDDPQTNESAGSPTQCEDREEVIEGAILGLAGPGQEIAAVMPLTVIRKGDLADRYLSRKIHPEWQGERGKMLYGESSRDDLWEQYARVRGDGLNAGDGGKSANEFYTANREAMDAGLTAAWPARKTPSDVSAIQHAMNIKLAKPAAFASEYQNEPLDPDTADKAILTAEQIAAKVNGHARGLVPVGCTRLTVFIDVQQDLLYYAACAFEDDFTGYVTDYGTFPDQRRAYFTLRDARHTMKGLLKTASFEETLRAALERLCERLIGQEWAKEDGTKVKPDRVLIDANWPQSRDVVYKFCRESVYSAILLPSHGVGVGATSTPFSERKVKKGERKGLNWHETLTPDRPIQRRLSIDTNHFKSFVHERFAVPTGSPGSLSIFGSSGSTSDHRMFADQQVAEQPVKVEAKGRTVIEWKLPPAKPDNHLGDCIAGCHAAAAERGAKLKETGVEAAKPRKKMKFSEMMNRG
jgi:hypothetical protein